MLQLFLVALFQAAAGDPAPVVESTPQENTQGGEQSTEQATPPPERARCRQEAEIGTRMTRRVCLTPSQERQLRNDARTFTDRAQRQNPLQGN